jgi:hypothetical protein
MDIDRISGLVYIGRRRLQEEVRYVETGHLRATYMSYFCDLNLGQKYICCNNDAAGSVALDFAIKADGVYVHTVAVTINKYGYDL